MKVIRQTQENPIANVYVAETKDGKRFEFVESTQPPLTIREKWVIVISTLHGCPVDCKFCDAGGSYNGKLSFEELSFQVDYVIRKRFPGGDIDTDKFKIQFSRMGEPSFNKNVIEFLLKIPERYKYKNFIPSLSTVAPIGEDAFFEKLLEVRKNLYDHNFQLQFSLHSTDEQQRDDLIPVRKWSFNQIADYGERFYTRGGRKITLNFAIGKEHIIEPGKLLEYFDPQKFLIKITPVNPTCKAKKNKIDSLIRPGIYNYVIIENLRMTGYEVILSIGEWEENKIGSNCGQYINNIKDLSTGDSYSYQVEDVDGGSEKCEM